MILEVTLGAPVFRPASFLLSSCRPGLLRMATAGERGRRSQGRNISWDYTCELEENSVVRDFRIAALDGKSFDLRWASFDEIKENDFNLNIPRYVDTLEEVEEIEQLEGELSKVRKMMGEYLKELEIQ